VYGQVLVLLEFESVDGSNVTVKLLAPDDSEMWSQERVSKGQYGFTTPQVNAPTPQPTAAAGRETEGQASVCTRLGTIGPYDAAGG
jgi:hypothetical protein